MALQHCSTAALQDCSTVALQHCSTHLKPILSRSRVTSVNSCQLKRNVTVHSGTADPSSAVLWLWAVVPFVILRMTLYHVFGLEYRAQGLRHVKCVQKCRGVKNLTYYKTVISSIHGTTQHVVLL